MRVSRQKLIRVAGGVEASPPIHVGRRQARVEADFVAAVQISAVAAKVSDHVAAIAEEVHDVFVVGGMDEAQAVATLMEAGQIDNRVAEERITPGFGGDVGAEGV